MAPAALCCGVPAAPCVLGGALGAARTPWQLLSRLQAGAIVRRSGGRAAFERRSGGAAAGRESSTLAAAVHSELDVLKATDSAGVGADCSLHAVCSLQARHQCKLLFCRGLPSCLPAPHHADHIGCIANIATCNTMQDALAAAQGLPLERLMRAAAEVRDAGHRHITFSPKVFIPLTRLCRDRWVEPEGSFGGLRFVEEGQHLSSGLLDSVAGLFAGAQRAMPSRRMCAVCSTPLVHSPPLLYAPPCLAVAVTVRLRCRLRRGGERT